MKHVRIRAMDESFILGPFFGFGNKRAFHIDAHQLRSLFILMGSCRAAYPCQSFFIQCHGSRCDGGHAAGKLIIRQRLNRLLCPVTKIMAHASMKMDIHKPRDGITAFPVKHLIFRRIRCDPLSQNPDFSILKLIIGIEYLHIFNSHRFPSSAAIRSIYDFFPSI